MTENRQKLIRVIGYMVLRDTYYETSEVPTEVDVENLVWETMFQHNYTVWDYNDYLYNVGKTDSIIRLNNYGQLDSVFSEIFGGKTAAEGMLALQKVCYSAEDTYFTYNGETRELHSFNQDTAESIINHDDNFKSWCVEKVIDSEFVECVMNFMKNTTENYSK